MTVFIRNPYNYDVRQASIESGLKCEDASRTVQSGKDDADINVIVKRFGLTGKVPVNVRTPLSSDFVDIMDFRTAMEAVRRGQESFAELGSDVRRRFNDDPASFVQFCLEEKDGKLVNYDEMVKFGLAVPKAAEPEPVPADSK